MESDPPMPPNIVNVVPTCWPVAASISASLPTCDPSLNDSLVTTMPRVPSGVNSGGICGLPAIVIGDASVVPTAASIIATLVLPTPS